ACLGLRGAQMLCARIHGSALIEAIALSPSRQQDTPFTISSPPKTVTRPLTPLREIHVNASGNTGKHLSNRILILTTCKAGPFPIAPKLSTIVLGTAWQYERESYSV